MGCGNCKGPIFVGNQPLTPGAAVVVSADGKNLDISGSGSGLGMGGIDAGVFQQVITGDNHVVSLNEINSNNLLTYTNTHTFPVRVMLSVAAAALFNSEPNSYVWAQYDYSVDGGASWGNFFGEGVAHNFSTQYGSPLTANGASYTLNWATLAPGASITYGLRIRIHGIFGVMRAGHLTTTIQMWGNALL